LFSEQNHFGRHEAAWAWLRITIRHTALERSSGRTTHGIWQWIVATGERPEAHIDPDIRLRLIVNDSRNVRVLKRRPQ
jgi:hypothetical protein